MNILLIATFSGISGASKSLVTLAEQLKMQGVNPIVIIPKNGEIENLLLESEIQYKKIRLFNWIVPFKNNIRFNGNISWIVKNAINLIQEIRLYLIIKKNKIDVVHINAVTANWGYKASKWAGVKLVWHVREFLEEDLNKRFRNKEKSLNQLRKADRVVAISKSVSNKYKPLIGNNLITIYNGIDSNKFINEGRDIFNTNTIKCTLAGRLTEEKGIMDAIEAFNLINTQENLNHIYLEIIGEGDKNYIDLLVRKVREYGLHEQVQFLGYKNNVNEYFLDSDIVLVSSKAEAFGRVTIEAMLSQSLVIGADTQGTQELIGKDKGLLYKQGSGYDLAQKIKYAISNKEAVRKIAISGREYASKFSAEKNATEIHKLYIEIIN